MVAGKAKRAPAKREIAYRIEDAGENRWAIYRAGNTRPIGYAPTLKEAKAIVRDLIKNRIGITVKAKP